ncbi:MAG: acetyl-CoA carboxylase biotin carboxylase subunit [Planctomycetota bacterium]|nr:MAG: acetyl-CoA carboxylase biotin carboxylase subunit [Planctomycetota bacterium]
MFGRILVAARGKTAFNIIRTCRELDIESVAVYAEKDRQAPYLRLATDVICIGPRSVYQNESQILAAAEIGDVEAIHPGIGPLAINAHFAEICESHELAFVGPPSKVLARLTNKLEARRSAGEIDVPVLPASEEPVVEKSASLAIADEIGYPVLVRAIETGSGFGVRIAEDEQLLVDALTAAAGDLARPGGIYLEKYLPNARHIEVCVIADTHGHVVSLGERDESLQRGHRTLVAEAPAPGIAAQHSKAMQTAAIDFTRSLGFHGAGSVQFVLDGSGNFYFCGFRPVMTAMPSVTEAVTGIDMHSQELRIASGEPLEFSQEDVSISGAAIGCRITAEDPQKRFSPTGGTLSLFSPPSGRGIRVDTSVWTGMEVEPGAEGALAQITAHRMERGEAIAVLRVALDEIVLDGVTTTLPLVRDLFGHTRFVKGEVDTHFVEEYFAG